MHHLGSPYTPLNTAPQRTRPRPASDTSTSPPSSRTASPPSSPTSSTRRHHSHHHRLSQASPPSHPHHLFNLSFHPHPHPNQPTSNPRSETDESDPGTYTTHPSASDPASHPQCGVSILPCAVLRGRSSRMVLRRRPSAVDMALNEERSRCDGDAIERQGLDLMEPRPVDTNANLHGSAGFRDPRVSTNMREGCDGRSSVQQPRFVMGGIFEVMEGRA